MATDSGTGWRHRLARLLRRFPWTGRGLQWAVRLIQPKLSVGVVGVVLDAAGERVLLVEHLFHADQPWGLPGGWLERGEEPRQTVERELREETGLRVRAERPLLVRRGHGHPRHLDIVYLCALDGADQTVRLNGELLSYRWAGRDDLPPLADFQAASITAALEG